MINNQTDLPDHANFKLDVERWEQLQDMLEDDPGELPRLESLLIEPGYCDSDE